MKKTLSAAITLACILSLPSGAVAAAHSGVALLAAGSTAACPASASHVAEEVVMKALRLWLKAYRRGKLDLVDLDRYKGKPKNKKDFVSIKLGIIPEGRLARLNHEKELALLCEKVAELGTADAAKLLLEVAATGLDGKKHDNSELTGLVRGFGERALRSMKSAAVHDRIREIAESPKGAVGRASLRALGRFGDAGDVSVFEDALKSGSEWIRLAAARGLGQMNQISTLEQLAALAVQEDVEVVVCACLESAKSLIAKPPSPDDDEASRVLRKMTTSAHDVLGKHAWQVDQAALEFLQRIRSADTVPALIGVLERSAAAMEKGASLDKTSGVVRRQAHELLLSLTGATFPIDAPHLWRDWWGKASDTFEVAKESDGSAVAGKTSTSFFGIPVRGSHVLFIVDFSGSMDFDSLEEGASSGQILSRMEVARRELKGAIGSLAGDSHFNLVSFNTKVDGWKPKLVPATDGNKKGFFKFIDKARPAGGTNVWGGLERGFGLDESAKEGDDFDADVDEIFLLSDGEPSAGSIIDPKQILDAVQDANMTRRIRINTVFVPGTDPPGMRGRKPDYEIDAPELMRRLAKENGGVFIQPGSTGKVGR